VAKIKERQDIEPAKFKSLLEAGAIRPASVDDVWGTHHDRPLINHPNTGQPYVTTMRMQ